MRIKKHAHRKSKKTDIELLPEEKQELEMILDRLSVQNPNGQSFENYLQSLRAVLAGRSRVVAALLDRLSRWPSEVSFHTFEMLADLLSENKYRRIIKRAGYRFAQRGFEIRSEKPGEQPVVLIPKEGRKATTHMIVTDETGWFVSGIFYDDVLRDLVAVSAFSEESFERLTIQMFESSHKLYREYIQKLTEHLPYKPYEVPLWHAARIYFEMLRFVRQKPASSEVERVKRFFAPYDEPERKPYVYELMPEVDDPNDRLSEVDTEGLLGTFSILRLFFSKDELRPYFQKILDLERSVLVVRQELQQERALEVLRSAVDDLCVGEKGLLFQRFFEEHALFLKLAGKDDLAFSAWIVAQHLKKIGKPGQIPFLFQLAGISLKLHWPEDVGTDEQEEVEESSYYTTESGLILPK